MIEAALICMSLNVYHEARDQSVQGQALVAQVVMNRVADRRWPDDVCAVIYDKDQFSWTHDGKSDTPRDPIPWAIAQAIAKSVMQEPLPFTGAVYYHAGYVSPDWARRVEFVEQVDEHVFYR